jgi:hypothetical protein
MPRCSPATIGTAAIGLSVTSGVRNIDSVLRNFQWRKFCGATLRIGSRFKDTDNGFHDAFTIKIRGGKPPLCRPGKYLSQDALALAHRKARYSKLL